MLSNQARSRSDSGGSLRGSEGVEAEGVGPAGWPFVAPPESPDRSLPLERLRPLRIVRSGPGKPNQRKVSS